jgi:hypothetical protein
MLQNLEDPSCRDQESFAINHQSFGNDLNFLSNGMFHCATGVDMLRPRKVLHNRGMPWHFGMYLFQKGAVQAAGSEWFFASCVAPSTARRWMLKDEGCESLEDLIASLPGRKFVRFAPTDLPDGKIGKIRYLVDGVYRDVVSITWIPPFAAEAYNRGRYLELDCSFPVTPPFVYCVPQSIRANEAIPLGFITTPTEKAVTYELFLQDLWAAFPGFPWKDGNIILSDEGSGLVSFGREQGLRLEWLHFFCHAHLIRKFGARGFLGMLVSLVLSLLTKQAFEALRPVILALAESFLEETHVPLEKFEAFQEFLSGEFQHGLWVRSPLGVGRCSNHAERFHGVIRFAISLLRSLVLRLRTLCEYIQERYDNYQLNLKDASCPQRRRQLWYTVNQLIARGHGNSSECTRPYCVQWRKMMGNRYEIENFPCEHTAKYWKDHLRPGAIPDMPDIPLTPMETKVSLLAHERFEVQATTESFKAISIRTSSRACLAIHTLGIL